MEVNGVEPMTLPKISGRSTHHRNMNFIVLTVVRPNGGGERSRTDDPLLAKQVL